MLHHRNFPGLLLLVCYISLIGCSYGSENITTGKRSFYLLTLLPYVSPYPGLNPSWSYGDDIQPALDLAADQINQRNDILANFSLQLVHLLDGCDDHLTAVTLGNFVEGTFANKERNIAGVIGPSCSSSTAALAPLVGRSEINTVSIHDAGSPTLANRSEYSHLLGVLGPTNSFIKGFFYLIGKGDWTRIAVLYDDSRQYFKNTKRLFLDLIRSNFSDVTVEYFSPVSETYIPLEDIQQRMLRVIFILAPISLAQNIMCRAYNLSMTFNTYQYVLMSARLEDFSVPVKFNYNQRSYECSSEHLRNNILNGSFLLFYNLRPKSGEELLSNMTYIEYIAAYEKYRERHTLLTGKNSTESYWATNLYDAVWAWALVLDGLTKDHGDFELQYGDKVTSDRIIEQFYELNFEGMSGTMVFDYDTGFVKREIVIFQALGNFSYFVIFIGPNGSERCNGTEMCGVPIEIINDSFQIRVVRESSELAAFFLLINLAEIFIIVFLHITTMVNRKMPSVKATSLKLLNISYIGTYILILGTLLWTLFSAASINIQLKHYFCQLLWAWTIPVGFSLSLGPVVMKTWRLYRIFEHYLDPGPLISTPYLITGTLLIASLYLTVSVSWTASDRFVLNATEHFDNEEASQVVITWYCVCNYRVYWLVSVGLLSLGLLSVGTVLALLTRKIRHASFGTSSLRVLMYLMSIVIVLGSSLYGISEAVGKNDHMSYFSFSTLCIFLNAVISLFIACIFIPPLLPLARKTKVRFRKISSSL